jgi:hypothetical protein
MAKYRRLPPTWGEIDSKALQWFLSSLYLTHPEARLCHCDWKALKYCQGHFLDWRKTHVGSADIVRQLNKWLLEKDGEQGWDKPPR